MSGRRNAVAAALAVLLAMPALPAAGQGRPPVAFAWAEAVKGDAETRLRWPVAVAAGTQGELLVADAWGRRLVALREEASGWQVTATVELPGVPVGATHDGSRYLVTMRKPNQLMAVEGPALRLRPVTLPTGTVPGALAGSRGGGLLVFDQANGAVLMLDEATQLQRAVPIEGHVTALAPRPDGGFHAAVARPAEIWTFDAGGDLVARRPVAETTPAPAWPSGLAATDGGDLLIVDRHAARLLLLDSGGRLAGVGSRKGWEPGLVYFPAGLTLLPDGRVAVADQGNGRVQLFHRLAEGAGQ